jgi:uncharacterized membrane protein YkvA (DUF1232 family)
MDKKLSERINKIKHETYALYLASRDKRTPWYARALVWLIAGYALSPIDLIPDFIPVIGYFDDLILVPLGISIALRLIPKEAMEAARKKAKTDLESKESWKAGIVVLILWILAIAFIYAVMIRQ